MGPILNRMADQLGFQLKIKTSFYAVQHILGTILAIYLVGFSMSYWRSLDRQLTQPQQSQEYPQDYPQDWRSGVGLILRLILPELLWFMPHRWLNGRSAQESKSTQQHHEA